MKYSKFEEMPIWQESIQNTEMIYALTSINAFSKDFSLRDQIRRASISISSNIAEGFERDNHKEFIRFLSFAKASAGEVRSQLYLAIRIGYVDIDQGSKMIKQLKQISSSIQGLINYLKRFKK